MSKPKEDDTIEENEAPRNGPARLLWEAESFDHARKLVNESPKTWARRGVGGEQ